MRSVVLGLVLLLFASLASAQAITGYDFRIYNQGAQQPLQGPTALVVVCNQTLPPTPTGSVSNPTTVFFKDPVNAGKGCLYTDPGTGLLSSLPFGAPNYEATVSAKNSVGSSPESARSNLFTRPGSLPGAPQGLGIAKLFTSGFKVFGSRHGRVAGNYRLMPALHGLAR